MISSRRNEVQANCIGAERERVYLHYKVILEVETPQIIA